MNSIIKQTQQSTKVVQFRKRGGAKLEQLKPAIQELVIQNNWQGLVEAGKFELKKAVLSIQWTKQEVLQSVFKVGSMREVLKTESATLATVKKYRGEIILNAAIHSLLYDLKDFFSVGKGMNDRQIKMLSQIIFSEYYFLTIADLKFCFFRAMRGDYGKLYNRLDGGVIMEWIGSYAEEKAGIAETVNLENKSEESKGVEMPEEFTKFLEKHLKSFPIKETKRVDKVETIQIYSKTLERYKEDYKESNLEISFDEYMKKQTAGLPYKEIPDAKQ